MREVQVRKIRFGVHGLDTLIMPHHQEAAGDVHGDSQHKVSIDTMKSRASKYNKQNINVINTCPSV